MSDVASTILLLLCLLQIKHMFADYFLQTPRMLADRAIYIHAGRAQHAVIHAVGSAIAFLLIGAPAGFIMTLCIVEMIVHFHIDWGKARHSAASGCGPSDARFWRAAGIDQALHQLTYVAMIWAWAYFVAA